VHESSYTLYAIQCFILPSQVVEAFERLCEPLDDSIEGAEIESRTLAQLSDTRLPKMISGELRIKNADAFLKERGL